MCKSLNFAHLILSKSFLEQTAQQRAWSARVIHAILKIARTSADMRGDTAIAKSDLQLGIDCRQPFSKKEEGRLYWHSLKR